jgi:hypothetical protein
MGLTGIILVVSFEVVPDSVAEVEQLGPHVRRDTFEVRSEFL